MSSNLLHRAAREGDLEALREGIARGDDVDGRGAWRRTPLMEASASGHHECAQALIDVGAAVDMVDDNGWTALMYACIHGHHECAQPLIDASAAVDQVNNHGSTALTEACFGGHHECAQALIDAGAAVDMVNNHGWTALMYTCVFGHYECTRALVNAQADLELTNRDGKNALMIACKSPPSNFTQSQRQGRIRCALALLEAMTPIREADSTDRVAVLKVAGERLQLIEAVLASTHVIEDAPSLASVGALKAEAQDVFVNFASHVLAIAKLPKPRRRSRRLAAKRSTVR